MLIEKIKSGIIIALLVLLSITSSSSYLLYKSNNTLTEKVSELKGNLKTCEDNVDFLKKERETADETLDLLLAEQDIVNGEFDSLKKKFGELKCKAKKEGASNVKSDQVSTTANTVADDIRSVGLLLERATCRANSDCITTESPSK